jgi:hypothetical protein
MTLRDLHRHTLTRAIESDPFISLSAAAKLLPGERPGRSVSPSTVYRWASKGLPLPDGRVIKLAVWRIGRKWVTSRGALAEFIEAQQPGTNEPLATPRTPTQRERASNAAARELDGEGV